MKFTITLGMSGEVFTLESDSLSMEDVLLMVAQQFGEEWYGCSISCDNGNFYCNAVKDYHCGTGIYAEYCSIPEAEKNKSVYQRALDAYVAYLKIKNSFCTTRTEGWYEETVTSPMKNIFKEV